MFITAPLAPRARLRVPPIATAFLVAANLAAAAWTLSQSNAMAHARASAMERLGSPATAAGRMPPLRRAALAAELAAIAARDPLAVFGYERGAVAARALSALFVHADAPHVLANMIALGLAGACLEQAWGAVPTLALFLLAGAAGLVID